MKKPHFFKNPQKTEKNLTKKTKSEFKTLSTTIAGLK